MREHLQTVESIASQHNPAPCQRPRVRDLHRAGCMLVDPASQPSRCCTRDQPGRGLIPSQIRILAPDEADKLAWQGGPPPAGWYGGYPELDDTGMATTADAPLVPTVVRLVLKLLGQLEAVMVDVHSRQGLMWSTAPWPWSTRRRAYTALRFSDQKTAVVSSGRLVLRTNHVLSHAKLSLS